MSMQVSKHSCMRLMVLSLCAVLLILSGCSTDDSPTASKSPGSIINDPSFSTDIQPIFISRGCTGSNCHGSALQDGLDLRTGAAYASLVNVDAVSENFKRVLPGNAQDSYLVIKLEGRQTVGSQMPLVGAHLDNVELTNIRNWINNGAKNN